MGRQPLLFLDVDGPLNPYAAHPQRRPQGYTEHRMKPAGWVARHGGRPRVLVPPLRVALLPAHGPALAELGYELHWATTWMGDANDCIAPVLGLPRLPFVEFPEAPGVTGPDGVHWKTRELVAYADGRPFAWVDDEISEADEEFVAAHHPAPALLYPVDPRLGLSHGDFVALRKWASSLAGDGEQHA